MATQDIFIEGINSRQVNTPEVELSMDIFEADDTLFILAPLAGINLEEIKIQLSDDILSISGERILPEYISAIHSKKYFVQECHWGKFSRSIVLPTAVNSADIIANAENDILRITIPKARKNHDGIISIARS